MVRTRLDTRSVAEVVEEASLASVATWEKLAIEHLHLVVSLEASAGEQYSDQ